MQAFLTASCPVALPIITALEALFVILALRGWFRKKEPLYLLTALVAFGLFYDALILSLGALLQNSPAFPVLSKLRFVAHGALIPLLFPICAYALDFSRIWKTVVWIFTGLVIAAGIAEGLSTVLMFSDQAGIARLMSNKELTPSWASTVSLALSVGAVIPVILAGIVVWIRQKTPLLFLSGFLMFAFSALGPATGNFDLIFFISMFGEVCMALCFLLYARRRAA